MNSKRGLAMNVVSCLSFVLAFFIFLSSSFLVSATEQELPSISCWVNGLALSDDGTYIRDSWAIDETNVSSKKYVLLGQNGEETMRVAKYPEDISNGDTTPCEKYSLSLSFVVPEGLSGDVIVTFEGKGVLYSFVAPEDENYCFEAEVYPGVYEITEIEAMSTAQGTYKVDEHTEIDVMDSDYTGSFVIVPEDSGETESASTEATEDVEDGQSGSFFWNDSGTEEDDELWSDTIKLAITVTVLLAIYAFIKHRREKSEEIH